MRRLVKPTLKLYSAVEPLQILCDEITSHQLLVGVDQSLGNWPRHLSGGKGSAVEAPHPATAQAGRGQETFIGGVGVVKVDVVFLEGDVEPAGEIDRRLAAYTRQDIALPGGQQTAVAHQEDIAALTFGEVAVDVEQHRPGGGVLRLYLAVGEDQVEILVHLGARRQRVGWRAPQRGGDDFEAVAEVLGPLPQRERYALDDHIGPVV